MPKQITVKKDDTEPLDIEVDAAGMPNLDQVDTVEFYMWKRGRDTNVVDGSGASVKNSSDQIVEFDPDGAHTDGGDAFQSTGTYLAYLKISWDDGDTTRHPADGHLEIHVQDNRE